jgi:hypothetical protein
MGRDSNPRTRWGEGLQPSAIATLPPMLNRAGRSRTCLRPRIRRLPHRSASARSRQRPGRDSNPSRLFDKQVATPAASQGVSARTEGFEPSACGLEPHCSPRSTSLWGGRWESNPRSPVHSRVPIPLRVRPQYPREESNLTSDLRRVVCYQYTSRITLRSPFTLSTPTRNRTWICSFGGSHDLLFTIRAAVPGAGVEPTRTGSEPAVLPLDDPGSRFNDLAERAMGFEPIVSALATPCFGRLSYTRVLTMIAAAECPAGVEPACSVWKTDAWAARPRAPR